MSLLEVRNLSHSYGDKILYKNTSFEINSKEHAGLVGANGTGKSTLIKILTGNIIADDGLIKWHPKIKIGYLDQYAEMDKGLIIFEYLKTAYKHLFSVEEQIEFLNEKIAEAPTDELIEKVVGLYKELDAGEFYSLETQIKKVATGLGITALGLDTKIEKLSGGQRAKVILAKLLLENPNVLILDEPTNFLDKEHVDWLAKYLKNFNNTFIIISHNSDFLDIVATCIYDIDLYKIKKYSGNYEKYLSQKNQKQDKYIKQYENQQKFIKKTQDYIDKNKARASTAKMAKSREKILDKLDKILPPKANSQPNINFLYTKITTASILEVNNLEVGYYYPLLPKLNFTIRNGQKIVITGFNGIGKSTLLKTLVGKIPLLDGQFRFAVNSDIGYYEQDLFWKDSSKTPLHIISDCYPNMQFKDIRKALSYCSVKAEHAMQAVETLSGGEQSKVKLCLLMLKSCNILVLDEPTNHLDIVAKAELKKALISFEGTIILVSHEVSFYKDWANEIINIEKLLASTK